MIENTLKLLRDASYDLAFLDESKVNEVLNDVADSIEKESESLLRANALDMAHG